MGSSFIRSLEASDYFAIALAALLTTWAALVLRRGGSWSLRALMAGAFLPVPAVALFSRQFNIVGWHAFMHASPIYQIMARGGPPEDPLYAGAALRYPWAEFWLTAQLARASGANPLTIALLAQTLAYLVFLWAAAWLASALCEDRVSVGLAVLLSAFGISAFHAGPFTAAVGRAIPSLWLETRVVPLDKFLSLTAMPIGYAAMLAAAAAGVRWAAGLGSPRSLLGCAALSTAVAVFIHPLSWLGILIVWMIAAPVRWAANGTKRRRELVQAALAVGVPSAVALPYLRSVGASQSSDGWLGFTDSFTLLSAKAADLGFYLAGCLLLVYSTRAQLAQRLRARGLWVVLLAIPMFSLAYLLVRAPGRNEYKFLLQLAPTAAALMAAALRELEQRHRALALSALFCLLLPGGKMLGVRPWFEVTDPARLEGQYQRALNPLVDQLYQWVALNTPPDAVFIAADLRMPALGRRSLFVAVDAPWRGRDGWGLPRNSLLQWHIRRPDAEMYRRQSLATIVLSPDWAEPCARVMSEIQAAVPGRRIFVHASLASVDAKLDATPGFRRLFGNRVGSIHEWLP